MEPELDEELELEDELEELDELDELELLELDELDEELDEELLLPFPLPPSPPHPTSARHPRITGPRILTWVFLVFIFERPLIM